MDTAVEYGACRGAVYPLCRDVLSILIREKITVTVAEDLADAVLGAKGRDASLEEYNAGDKIVPWQVVATLEGRELVGMHYRQLLPWVNPGEGRFPRDLPVIM